MTGFTSERASSFISSRMRLISTHIAQWFNTLDYDGDYMSLSCSTGKAWVARKCLWCSKETKYYGKDRPNNPSGKRGQPSINCQEYLHRNESLSRMLTEYHVNLTTFGRSWIKWTSSQEEALCFLEEPEGPSCICARTPDMVNSGLD
uniref:GATA-type domain-containing protein n=1 Tax=Heterorhabditis bacteriophora TaxID=37862 RepID=A0A1I7WN00_HETBA